MNLEITNLFYVLDTRFNAGNQRIQEFKTFDKGLDSLQVEAISYFQRNEFRFIESARDVLLFMFLGKTCCAIKKNIVESRLKSYENQIKDFPKNFPLIQNHDNKI